MNTESLRALERRRGKPHGAGMTLVEVMVALGVASILLLSLLSLHSFSIRSMAGLLNNVELERQSQHALDILSRDIRQVLKMVDNTSTSLTFLDQDSAMLQFIYDPSSRTLRRVKGNRSEMLLEGCDSLSFRIMQRNTQRSSFDQFPAGSTATCKLIQIDWLCSRHILGSRLNTESMQSAKIVIRAK